MSAEHVGIAAYSNRSTRALEELIWVCGVETAIGNPEYPDGAVIPTVSDLRRPSQQELRRFLATDPTPDTGLIELIPATTRLIETIHNYDGPHLKQTVCPPNQLTTTIDEAHSQEVGLPMKVGPHIDDHEKLPANRRLESMRRIGLNLGPGSRYLLLGSVDAIDLAEIYCDSMDDKPTTGHVRRYVADKDQEPMLCAFVEIDPGNAYIGPSEVVVHDASRYRQELVSTVAFWLGHWNPGYFGTII